MSHSEAQRPEGPELKIGDLRLGDQVEAWRIPLDPITREELPEANRFATGQVLSLPELPADDEATDYLTLQGEKSRALIPNGMYRDGAHHERVDPKLRTGGQSLSRMALYLVATSHSDRPEGQPADLGEES